MHDVQLTIFSPVPSVVTELNLRLLPAGSIQAVLGTGTSVSVASHLDAIWLTGMQVTYFGIEPMLVSTSKVVVMPAAKQSLGFPPLIVAGWLSPKDCPDPSGWGLRYAELLLNAVDDYNSRSAEPILRVGSIPENLGLAGEHAQSTLKSLKEMLVARQEEQMRPDGVSATYLHA